MRDLPDLRETDPQCPVDGCHQHPRAPALAAGPARAR